MAMGPSSAFGSAAAMATPSAYNYVALQNTLQPLQSYTASIISSAMNIVNSEYNPNDSFDLSALTTLDHPRL